MTKFISREEARKLKFQKGIDYKEFIENLKNYEGKDFIKVEAKLEVEDEANNKTDE